MSSSKMILLQTSDGDTFELEETVAIQSQTIKHMIEDDCADNTIPLPNVTSKVMAKVIEYCKCHATKTDKPADEKIKDDLNKAFDAEFMKIDLSSIFDLILAANYLDIKSLLDLSCETVADMTKEMSPEEVRTTFNIKNDFTPEEEVQVRKENAWAFE
ncbi:hypothetical protein RD792_017014 [Penstemon davidsonii]|uniref:SKP1-like protein n=1 Tax=Penstemon davidsonii TaxID=160366 RepID=A0ABR0CKU2_9LAMI|nr:hypothetical protein RD792_017014 [Penstemon davidsonii]